MVGLKGSLHRILFVLQPPLSLLLSFMSILLQCIGWSSQPVASARPRVCNSFTSKYLICLGSSVQFGSTSLSFWVGPFCSYEQNCSSSASLLSSADCLSDKQRRWPEDIAWHPDGKKLFSVYSADNGDSQISILNLNKGKEVGSILIQNSL